MRLKTYSSNRVKDEWVLIRSQCNCVRRCIILRVGHEIDTKWIWRSSSLKPKAINWFLPTALEIFRCLAAQLAFRFFSLGIRAFGLRFSYSWSWLYEASLTLTFQDYLSLAASRTNYTQLSTWCRTAWTLNLAMSNARAWIRGVNGGLFALTVHLLNFEHDPSRTDATLHWQASFLTQLGASRN